MAKSQLKVANIIASSTDVAWTQTYHAGGVTAVVSVREKDSQKPTSLSLIGKDILNTFESEYFTLETKNLASIKQAVEITYKKSKDTEDISLIVSAVIQNAVYVVLAGKGKILLIRNMTLATLLESQGEDVLSASGFLQPEDIMILETPSFAEKVPSSKLLDTLSDNSVANAAEIISPLIHKESDGSAAALLFSYEEDLPKIQQNPTPKTNETIPQAHESEKINQETDIKLPPKSTKGKITHRQKIFLTIAVVLAIVFVGAIYFSLQKKQSTQNAELFSKLYQPAEKKYEEAQGLQDLNASLAHDDYVQAQQMLEAAKGKFPSSSSEEKQIQALLQKINSNLQTASTPQQTASLTKIDTSTSPFLAFVQKHTDAKYFAQDDTNFYFADTAGITRVNKSTDKTTQIIKNGGDWKSLGGFQTYLGNMYVLDTTDGIDKYPVGASGYGNKSAYFTSTTPDLSKAVSMTIDGSVWILGSDGTISKYTKGKQDNFTVTGLTKAFSSPTQITTTIDDNNVYILDNGNSRLVVLKKDGTFIADYVNSLLKTATQIDVNETGKKVYVLSSGNVYELDLK